MHSDLKRPHTRRQFLKGVGAVTALAGAGAGAGVGIWRALSGDDGGTGPATRAPPGRAQPSLDDFAQNVVAGGPGRGGIPALDEPRFVPASEADFLQDDDFVFGLADPGEPRAYPQPVLVWHEIVNDEIAGERVSVTYCPLTGSVVAFRGRAPDGRPLTFNTTGSLVNSNLLMFDRETDSEWPQLLATARVFASRAEGRALRFQRGSVRDRSAGSTWSATGEALGGPLVGAKLSTADFLDVMWFSWFAFFPRTKVVA